MRIATRLSDWIHISKLYRSAFPPCERKPLRVIRHMQKAGRTDVWIHEVNGVFAGFAATINGEQTVLIDYLAVCPTQRNCGIGSNFLNALLQYYAPKGVFVEIEWIQPGLPGYEIAQRRKEFYLRAGMLPFETRFNFFGVDMELVGTRCHLDFSAFKNFHAVNYSVWASEHILPITMDLHFTNM